MRAAPDASPTDGLNAGRSRADLASNAPRATAFVDVPARAGCADRHNLAPPAGDRAHPSPQAL